MGDRIKKLKTGILGVNVMETKELGKHLERMKKAMETQISNMESEQTLLAKRFENNLKRSAKIARNHEEIITNFPSTRRRIELQLYQKAWKSAFAGVSTGKVKDTEMPEIEIKSPSEALKEFHSTFQVPYKKEYSIQSRDLLRSATALDIRCSLWRKVSSSIEEKTRAKSAPPWSFKYKPPAHVQNAHSNALQTLGIKRSLVQPLSGQLQIDEVKLRRRRSKENEVESKAIRDFIETLTPLKIKPGPTQMVFDANALYGMSAMLRERNPKL